MSGDNPYEPPESELEPGPESTEGEIMLRSPRAVPAGRGITWIAEAFGLFKAFPMPWVTTGLTLFGLSMLSGLIPVAGGVFNTVVTSLVLSGIVLGCAAQEFGEEYSVNYLFVGFNKPQKIIALSLIYVGVMYTILILVLGPLGRTIVMGKLDPAVLEQQLEAQSANMLIVIALMLPVFMATWFAIALITLHGLSVLDAMRLSFLGSLRNLLPMLLFSVALGFLFFIAVLPFFLGLLIMYPIMLISTYTAYRDIFTHEQVGIK
ncbi:MAG: BPSS1780 family membrane protein [Gammaproteobacteria bacterium]